MLLAWSNQQLKRCCVSADRLRTVSGNVVAAAEDLLSAVIRAQNLGVLMSFRSIEIRSNAEGLALSLEEVDMHTRLLTPEGTLKMIRTKEPLAAHASVRSLVVDDLIINGRSVVRIAS